MTMLTETTHAGDFIISEADGHRSRENVMLAAGQNLQAGAVLGKQTSGGAYASVDQQASDGSQTAFGILYAAADATDGAVEVCIIARDAEVNGHQISWGSDSGADITTGATELAAVGIIVRN